MNPHFRKGTKSKSGSGHVWVLAEEGGPRPAVSCQTLMNPSPRPLAPSLISLNPQDGALPVKLISNESEAAEAVRNILSGRHLLQEQPGRNSQPQSSSPETLQRSAEQILAGVKRPTAVESAAALQFVTDGELRI